MCLYPQLIRNPKYTETVKNGGIIPFPPDRRVLWIPIACNRCRDCMKKKARDWQVRLHEDIKTNKNGKFVTLTFSNEYIKKLTKELPEYSGYELDNQIATLAIKRFSDRWKNKYEKRPRHWFVTELGHNGTENIHLHGIIWTDKPIEEIKRIWKYGFVWPRNSYYQQRTYVNEKTINYCIKYFYKKDILHTEYRPITLTSPKIGANYIYNSNAKSNKYKPNETREYYTTRQGKKIALPIYWRNKIYTEEERELLWIEKMDMKILWIGGYKIDISNQKGQKEYLKVLKQEQRSAKKLGFLDNKTNWKQKEYEESMRFINQQKRINNAS